MFVSLAFSNFQQKIMTSWNLSCLVIVRNTSLWRKKYQLSIGGDKTVEPSNRGKLEETEQEKKTTLHLIANA